MLDITGELVSNFMTEWGVDSGNNYIDYIGKIMDTWEPGSSEWTFAQFSNARPGIVLGIPAVNMSSGKYVLFSSTTHPRMKLLDAVRASSAIPMFFTPWKDEKGDIFCDGALKEHFPWECIPSNLHDATLLIACHDNQLYSLRNAPIYTLPEYISRIFYFMCHHHHDVNSMPLHRIVVNDCRMHVLDFFHKKEDRLALVQSGIDAATAWLTKCSLQENGEIHSSFSLPDTLSSDRTEPSIALDNPQSQSQQQHLAHSPGLLISSKPISRRWSL